jgi:uncharacterized UPF0160 family protein
MFNFFKKKYTVVTHDGRFHADEIFACAVLDIFLKGNIKVIRTREEDIINNADFVLDVGGVYDHQSRRYDHHQSEGAGERANGIPYATAGLIWLHYGKKIIKSEELWLALDSKLVQPIDAIDNGVDLTQSKFQNIYPYSLQSIVSSRMPTWREEFEVDINTEFASLVDFMKEIIKRELEIARDMLLAKKEVIRAIEDSDHQNILVLNKNYPFDETLQSYPNITFVISPRPDGSWRVAGVRNDLSTFDSLRMKLPSSWGGLRGEALKRISGENGARFCHNKLFLCVADNKESAIRLAKKALTY